MELRESRAQAAIARKEKNAAATKATELKQVLASVSKQNKVIMSSYIMTVLISSGQEES